MCVCVSCEPEYVSWLYLIQVKGELEVGSVVVKLLWPVGIGTSAACAAIPASIGQSSPDPRTPHNHNYVPQAIKYSHVWSWSDGRIALPSQRTHKACAGSAASFPLDDQKQCEFAAPAVPSKSCQEWDVLLLPCRYARARLHDRASIANEARQNASGMTTLCIQQVVG